MLAISVHGGESWKTRRHSLQFGMDTIDGTPTLVSHWQTYPDLNVATWLIPPSQTHPNWHIRMHRLTVTSTRAFELSEAGFAIAGTSTRSGQYLSPYSALAVEGHMSDMQTSLAV